MLWAFVTRLNDVLAVIGFGTVMYWLAKLAIKVTRWLDKRRASRL